MDRHLNDEYVKRAQAHGYRSRAAYKLLELHDRDRILRPEMCVVDLGAAPGGWSQVAKDLVGVKGRVIALDLLPMEPIPGVEFIQGDFREDAAVDKLRSSIQGNMDLVISDMAPNVSGMVAVDQPRMMYLCELTLELARSVLNPGGGMVVKSFQGEGFDRFVRDLRAAFSKVVTRKPRSSRSRSREVYLVAGGYNV